MVIFHSYVSLPEGKLYVLGSTSSRTLEPSISIHIWIIFESSFRMWHCHNPHLAAVAVRHLAPSLCRGCPFFGVRKSRCCKNRRCWNHPILTKPSKSMSIVKSLYSSTSGFQLETKPKKSSLASWVYHLISWLFSPISVTPMIADSDSSKKTSWSLLSFIYI